METNIYKGNLDTNKSDGDNVFGVNFKANSNLDNNWKMTIEGKYADQETFMRRYGFSVVPVIIGLILGELVEGTLRQSLVIFDGNWLMFLSRPIVVTFFILSFHV